MTTTTHGKSERWLKAVLWTVGVGELLALPVVFFPLLWMQGIHEGLGMGKMPDGPIVEYLARSASALYAMHGAMTVFLARDLRRYGPAIRFWAVCAAVLGMVLIPVDWRIGMPAWWSVAEGTFMLFFGGLVLWLQSRGRREQRAEQGGGEVRPTREGREAEEGEGKALINYY